MEPRISRIITDKEGEGIAVGGGGASGVAAKEVLGHDEALSHPCHPRIPRTDPTQPHATLTTVFRNSPMLSFGDYKGGLMVNACVQRGQLHSVLGSKAR